MSILLLLITMATLALAMTLTHRLIRNGLGRTAYAIGAMFIAASTGWRACKEHYRAEYGRVMEFAPLSAREERQVDRLEGMAR